MCRTAFSGARAGAVVLFRRYPNLEPGSRFFFDPSMERKQRGGGVYITVGIAHEKRAQALAGEWKFELIERGNPE